MKRQRAVSLEAIEVINSRLVEKKISAGCSHATVCRGVAVTRKTKLRFDRKKINESWLKVMTAHAEKL